MNDLSLRAIKKLALVRGLGPVVLCLGFVANAAAATYNVPGNFSTIQAAINAASSGDKILVGPGVYTQNLTFGSKALDVESTAGAASTIIDVNGGVGVTLGGHSVLEGFTVTGARATFGAGVVVSSSGPLIKGDIFEGNTQNGGGYGAAIGGNSISASIDGNLFYNNTADPQSLSGVVCFINGTNSVITNNVFENNPTVALNLSAPAGSSMTVENNTFVGNKTAIRSGEFTASSYSNNILYGNTTGFLLAYPFVQPSWQNNLVYGNGTNYAGGMPDGTGVLGNISANPLFVSATDFHLTSNSPAVDSGLATSAPNHDFDGNARPQGNGVDMGAFELVPEPPGLVLAAIGLLGITVLAVRRRKCPS